MLFETKLKIGQVVNDRYRIAGQLGSGGMSIVYLAEDLRLKGKRWAVKESLCLAELHSDIQAEADMLITLDHPRLPRIVDFNLPDSEGYSYLIMDYIEGVSLSQLMKDNPGPLPSDFIIQVAKQLLEVLQYLHGHHPPIIYRDLKPSNIMLTLQKELMLIDFGIARSYRHGISEDTVKLGTVGFAAPEQYGSGQSQPVSDLYGLGALILYMATGGQCSQWESGMEDRLYNHMPERIIPVIRRLLRHHPEERYQNAEAVLQALVRVESQMTRENDLAVSVPLPLEKRKATVIALLGVASGLGTTHTSFAVSSLLALKGATAWADLSPNSSVYDRIRSMHYTQITAVPGTDEQSAFSWKGVHYWKRPLQGKLAELLRGDYQFVVLDLGTGDYDEALEEFKYSDIPVLIASGADWRLEDILVWLKRKGLQPEMNWKVGLPLAERSAAQLLQAAIGTGKVYGLPFQQDPFKDKGKLVDVINEMFEELLNVPNKSRSRGFFQKKG
ncbi:serine/threonine-protein kinase [Paenibacillus sp. FSL R10-2734]|uniref:serine/threonine protein kinase n=1 Tax=Paenibacillus sp. FSL R10-2734 TaxID=2954691 RepID=UPI0030DAC8E5